MPSRARSRGRIVATAVGIALALLAASAAADPPSEALELPPSADEAAEEEAAAPERAARERPQSVIDEVVTTANRRTEDVQDVPVSVTVLTKSDIESANLRDLGDLTQIAPNVTLGRVAGTSNGAKIYIRGVGQDDNIVTSEPGIGLYVDDVYLGRSIGALFGLFDVEAIEVLRGPQGTLYGKNTVGGAIKVRSVKPDCGLATGGRLSAGSDERRDGRFWVSFPLIEGEQSLCGRFSFATMNRDGFVRDLLNGDKLYDEDTLAGRLSLRWQSDRSDLLLNLDRTRDRSSSLAFKVLEINEDEDLWDLTELFQLPTLVNADTFSERVLEDPWQALIDTPRRNDNDILGGSLHWDYELGDMTLRSISSYRELDSGLNLDVDGTDFNWVSNFQDTKHQQWSQELQLLGSSWDDSLLWQAGVYFFREKAEEDSVVQAVQSLWDQFAATGALVPNVTTTRNEPTTTSWAAFGQADYSLSERNELSLGARFTVDRKELSRDQVLDWSLDVDRGRAPLQQLDAVSVSDSWAAFSPSAKLVHRRSDRMMLYAGISHGFKSGGFNGRAGPIADTTIEEQSAAEHAALLESYDPEELWSAEVGLRSQWWDERLIVNATLFYNQYSEIQLTTLGLNADSQIDARVVNAGEAIIQGGELEVRAAPVEGFMLMGGLGLTYARFLDWDDLLIDPTYDNAIHCPNADPRSQCQFGIEFQDGVRQTYKPRYIRGDASDRDLPNSPVLTYNLSALFHVPVLELGLLQLRADWSYQSKTYFRHDNTESLSQDAYGLLNGRISFLDIDDRFELALWGRNLLDREYLENGFSFLGNPGGDDDPSSLTINPGIVVGQFGAPRTVGVELIYRFY